MDLHIQRAVRRLTPASGSRKLASLALTLFTTSFVLYCSSGCSSKSPPVSVEGAISFKRIPIEKGAIRFIPDGGNPNATAVSEITQGRYSIPVEHALAPGKYLVSIYGFKETGRMIKIDESAPERKEEKQYIPRRYNDATQEQCQLTSGHNTLDFSLE